MSATLAEVVAHAVTVWQARVAAGSMTAASAEKYSRQAGALVDHARLLGITKSDELTDDFAQKYATSAVRVHGRVQHPASGAVRLRQSVWHSLMTIAVEAGVITAPVSLPRSPASRLPDTESCRPARDDEVQAVQEYAATKSGTAKPCAVALALSGAGTGECSEVFVADLIVASNGIHLPGTYRTSPRVVVPGTAWARIVLRQRVDELRSDADDMAWSPGWEHDTRLVPSGRPTAALRQSAISQTLGEALRRAGLADDLKPASLPAWAAAKVYERTGDLGEVAGFLGLSSLTLAARVIKIDWQTRPPAAFPDGPGRLP